MTLISQWHHVREPPPFWMLLELRVSRRQTRSSPYPLKQAHTVLEILLRLSWTSPCTAEHVCWWCLSIPVCLKRACSPLSICWMPQLGYAGLHRTIQNRNFSPIAQNDHFLKWQLHKLYSCIWKIPALALGILLTDFLYWENKVVCHRSQCFCDASEWCLAWSGSIQKCPTKFWVLGLLISVRAHIFFSLRLLPIGYVLCSMSVQPPILPLGSVTTSACQHRSPYSRMC